MKKIITTISALALVVSSFAFNAAPAYACSCMMPKPPQEALGESAAVFQGTVAGVRESEQDGYIVTFSVEGSWKGVDKASVEVSTARDSAACGIAFETGKTYLVYAHAQEDGSLGTGLCSRTHEIVDATADEDVAALGTTTLPLAPAGSSSYPYRPLVLAAGTVLVIGAAFVLARKKISTDVPPAPSAN